MPSILLPHLISCDESGYSGNDMLGSGQPFFSYASHDVPLDEAAAIIVKARAHFHTQMPELKASKLLRSRPGRGLLLQVLEAMEGRYIATVYEKRLALACKLFEYIFEPVLQKNSRLFYENNMHRFVAMFLYMQMKVSGADIDTLATEFEAFMRSLDPAKAPTLFGSGAAQDPSSMIGQILRFARGYNAVIVREARDMERVGAGKWVLDLSISALFSHLVAWGERHPLIEVACDDSKPLRALASAFDGMVNRPDEATVTMGKRTTRLTWNMVRPVAFASSATHAGIQLADLIAGVAGAMPSASDDPDLAPLIERVAPHLHPDCIMPDFGVLDLEGDEAPVNWVMLEGLATRADAGADPLYGMDAIYAYAKANLPAVRRSLSGHPDQSQR